MLCLSVIPDNNLDTKEEVEIVNFFEENGFICEGESGKYVTGTKTYKNRFILKFIYRKAYVDEIEFKYENFHRNKTFNQCRKVLVVTNDINMVKFFFKLSELIAKYFQKILTYQSLYNRENFVRFFMKKTINEDNNIIYVILTVGNKSIMIDSDSILFL